MRPGDARPRNASDAPAGAARALQRAAREGPPELRPSAPHGHTRYDGLERLTKINRGNLASGQITDANANYTQNWSALESLGNWRNWIEDTNGGGAGGSTTQARTHSKANEVVAITGSSPDWVDAVHNRNGNMTTAPKPGAESTALTLTYDAWNRLVKAAQGATTLGEYQYDGAHRRIVKLKPNGSNWDRRDYLYSCGWQVVEERELLNTASKTTVATTPKFQWVWDLRYIDAVVLRDENKDGDGDCIDGTDQRLYYTQDANFNTTALISTAGSVVERCVYDPYGRVSVLTSTWTSQSPTVYNNEVVFAGYRQDPETALYQVRHRQLHSSLGRWIQRDSLGYHDGPNLYQYSRSAPLHARDPLGLITAQEFPEWEDFKGKVPAGTKLAAETVYKYVVNKGKSTRYCQPTAMADCEKAKRGRQHRVEDPTTGKEKDIPCDRECDTCYHCKHSHPEFTVKVEFVGALSWVKPEDRTIFLLDHEHGHLYIAQYLAKLMEASFRNIVGVGISCSENSAAWYAKEDWESRYKVESAKWSAADDAWRKAYDDQTNNGKEGPNQLKWNEKFKEMVGSKPGLGVNPPPTPPKLP